MNEPFLNKIPASTEKLSWGPWALTNILWNLTTAGSRVGERTTRSRFIRYSRQQRSKGQDNPCQRWNSILASDISCMISIQSHTACASVCYGGKFTWCWRLIWALAMIRASPCWILRLDLYGCLNFFCPSILSLNEMASAQIQNLRWLWGQRSFTTRADLHCRQDEANWWMLSPCPLTS